MAPCRYTITTLCSRPHTIYLPRERRLHDKGAQRPFLDAFREEDVSGGVCRQCAEELGGRRGPHDVRVRLPDPLGLAQACDPPSSWHRIVCADEASLARQLPTCAPR